MAAAGPQLTEEQVRERVAVLKRLKELLSRQRTKFENYLVVLDHEHTDIEGGNVEAMTAHVEMEQSVVQEIFTIQKVIDPLEDMYNAAYPTGESEVPLLKTTLETMKQDVLKKSESNRALLRERMDSMRQEIAELKVGAYKRPNRVYGGNDRSGSLIDIKQ